MWLACQEGLRLRREQGQLPRAARRPKRQAVRSRWWLREREPLPRATRRPLRQAVRSRRPQREQEPLPRAAGPPARRGLQRRLQREQALLEVPPVQVVSLEMEVAVAQRLGEMA